MEIFRAGIDDIPKIIDVANATWKQTYQPLLAEAQVEYMYAAMYAPEKLKEQMENGVCFLIRERVGKILGFVAYEYRSEAPGDPVGSALKVIYIPKLYVKPEAQRKGIGKKFLQEIEKIGGENNCHFIELNVYRHNPALHFYERLGFFVHKSVDIPFGEYYLNDYVMRKSIQYVTP